MLALGQGYSTTRGFISRDCRGMILSRVSGECASTLKSGNKFTLTRVRYPSLRKILDMRTNKSERASYNEVK